MSSPTQKLHDDVSADSERLVVLKNHREALIELRMNDIERLGTLKKDTPQHDIAMRKWALHDADYDLTLDDIQEVQKRLKRNRALLEDGVNNPREM